MWETTLVTVAAAVTVLCVAFAFCAVVAVIIPRLCKWLDAILP